EREPDILPTDAPRLYGFRLIDSTMKGDSRVPVKQIVWNAMSRGILTHGDSLRSFECGGVGRAVRSMSGRHRIAAFPGDLAFGAGSRRFASVDNNSLRRAMDRTTARSLQRRGA